MNLPPFSGDDRELRLTALLLGELSETEAAALREEIAASPELQKLHDELARTIGLVREATVALVEETGPAAKPLVLAADKREKLLATFKTVTLPVQARKPRHVIPWKETGTVAAMLAVLAGVAVLLVRTSVLPEDRLAESMEFLYAGVSKKRSGGVTPLPTSALSLEDETRSLASGHGAEPSQSPSSKSDSGSINRYYRTQGENELKGVTAASALDRLDEESVRWLQSDPNDREANATLTKLKQDRYDAASKRRNEMAKKSIAEIDNTWTPREAKPAAGRYYYAAGAGSAGSELKDSDGTDRGGMPSGPARPTIYLGTSVDAAGKKDAVNAPAEPAQVALQYRSRYAASSADTLSSSASTKSSEVLSRRGDVSSSGGVPAQNLGDLSDGARFYRSSGAQPAPTTPPPASPEPQLFGSVVNGNISAPVGGVVREAAVGQQDFSGTALPSIASAAKASSGGGFGGGGGVGGGSDWSLGLNRGLATQPATPQTPPSPAQAQPYGRFEGKVVDGAAVVTEPLSSAGQSDFAGASEGGRTLEASSARRDQFKLSAGVRGFYDDNYSDNQPKTAFFADINGPVASPEGAKREPAIQPRSIEDLSTTLGEDHPAMEARRSLQQESESLAFQPAKDGFVTDALADGSSNGRSRAEDRQGEMRNKLSAQTKEESQTALRFGETTKELAAKKSVEDQTTMLAKKQSALSANDHIAIGDRLSDGLDRLEVMESKGDRAGRLAAIILPEQTDKELGEVVVAGKPVQNQIVAQELEQLAKQPADGRRRQLAENKPVQLAADSKKLAEKSQDTPRLSSLATAVTSPAANVIPWPTDVPIQSFDERKREQEITRLERLQEALQLRVEQEKQDAVSAAENAMVKIVVQAKADSAPKQSLLGRAMDGLTGSERRTVRVAVDKDKTDVVGLSGSDAGRVSGYDPYFLATEQEAITSRDVLSRAISSLTLNKVDGITDVDRKTGIARLKEKVSVSKSSNASLLEISVKDADPEVAATLANAVAAAYRRQRIEDTLKTRREGTEELQKRLVQIGQELALAKKQAPFPEEAAKEADAPAPRKPAPNAAVPQPDVATAENAFSTFSLNVSDVSFKLAAASLEKGVMPDAASVRTEEFINAFDYRDPEPPPGVPIAFATERARYPFAHDRDLVRFSVKTAAAGRQPGKTYNLVLAIDNSGSMERADRVRTLQECLRVLSRQLQPQDKISVVSFARTARLWMDGLSGNAFGELPQMIGTLTPEGGTNLEEAMNLAYKTALRHFVPGGVNRVVLITDGAANLGDVEPDSLKQKVEAHRKQGVALDCFGIGWDGLNDDLLEVLSRNGDGRYGFINTPEAAATEFAGQLAGALKVAASDVKVQVEWNPRRVSAWRQIGYAKHQLTKEQFRDNTVDAAEIAAAEAGNALYTVQVNPAGEGPLGTVRVRFRVPNTSDYREHEWMVPYAGPASALDQASSTLRLAATASAFSEWLVASPFAAEVTPSKLLGYLQGVPQLTPADPRPQQLETMIRQAKTISGQ